MPSLNNTIRWACNEQFSRGTTIDGLRMDFALQRLMEKFNKIPRGTIKQRFVEQTYSMGWCPVGSEAAQIVGEEPYDASPSQHLPWLDVYNDVYDNAAAPFPVAVTPLTVNLYNPWRHKGHFVHYIDPTNAAHADYPKTEGEQYAWTTMKVFTEPAILSHFTTFLGTHPSAGDDYQNTFQWPAGGTTPSGVAAEDYVDDIFVEVLVDSQFAPEDASKSALASIRWRFYADAFRFSDHFPASIIPANDMTLPDQSHLVGGVNGIPPAGLAIDKEDLDIPIPANSRVRFAIIIPRYDEDTYDSPWGEPFDQNYRWCHNQHYSVTIHVLEQLMKGEAT